MDDLFVDDKRLLQIFENKRALEVLKQSLAEQGLTIYSIGIMLRKSAEAEFLSRRIKGSMVKAESFLS